MVAGRFEQPRPEGMPTVAGKRTAFFLGVSLALAACGPQGAVPLESAEGGPINFSVGEYTILTAGGCMDRVALCFRSEDAARCVRTQIEIDACNSSVSAEPWSFVDCETGGAVSDMPDFQPRRYYSGHGSLFFVGLSDGVEGPDPGVTIVAEPGDCRDP